MDLARDIVRREQELARLRSEFARLVGDDAQLELSLRPATVATEPAAATAPPVAARPPLARTSTLALRILSLLDADAGALTANELQVRLASSDSIDTIRTTLSKLAGRGAIERVGLGAYVSSAKGGSTTPKDGGKRTA